MNFVGEPIVDRWWFLKWTLNFPDRLRGHLRINLSGFDVRVAQ